jgi:hypothetical protein
MDSLSLKVAWDATVMNLRFAIEDRKKAQQRIDEAVARLRDLAIQGEVFGAGEITEQVCNFADAWDRLAEEFNECCDKTSETYYRAKEILAALRDLQQRRSALESEAGAEHLQPIADVDLDEIVIEPQEWVYAGLGLPLVLISHTHEADEDEDEGEAAQ